MDFNSLFTVDAHEAGAELNLTHPVTGEKTDVFIRLLGVDSKAFRALARQRNRQRFADEKESPEDAEARDLQLLADATLGWKGLTDAGKPLKFSREAALELYEKSPAVRYQVDSFILNRRNFSNG